MKKYMLPLVPATLCCVAALAADRTAVTADHSAGGTGDWWMTAENWNPAGVPGESDGCLITKANGSATCRFGKNGTAASFTGNSLQIGEVGKGLVVLVDESTPNTPLTFPGAGLKLGHASFRAWDNVPNAVIKGNLTILSTGAAPSDFNASKANTTYTIDGKLIGGDTACLKLVEADNSNNPQLTFPLTFDGSGFAGTLVYEPYLKPIKSTFGSVTFNGSIIATNSDFTVPRSVAATVSRMEVQGTDVKLTIGVENAITGQKTAGMLTIGDFVLGGGAKLRYAQTAYPGGWKQGDDGMTTWPFLTVPITSALTPERFALEKRYSMTSGIFYPEFDIVVVTNLENGVKTFVSRRRRYIQVEASTAVVNGDGSKFCWGGYDEETDFFTKGSVSRVLSTPRRESCVFGGKSLCLWSTINNATDNIWQEHGLQLETHSCTIGDFRLQCGGFVRAAYVYNTANGGNDADEATLDGGMTLFTNGMQNASARARFVVGGFLKSLNIMSNISGAGDAVMAATTEGDQSQFRTLTLGGDNTGWTGGMLVTNAPGVANRFVVTRKEALGGPLAAFRADALELGANAIWYAPSSITVDEPTRGVKVSGDATVDVTDGVTLGIGSDLAYASGVTLAKTGAGVLVLGGRASVSGNAALDVQEGYVKPLETNCLAGVVLSFAQGTALMMEVPEAGAEGVGRYGIVNPTLAAGATLRVKVPFASEPQTGGGKLTVPICTVAAASANAMKGRIAVEKPWGNFVGKVGALANGDGTVTLVAEIMRSGMCLVFR